MTSSSVMITAVIAMIALGLTVVAAYVTHIVVALKALLGAGEIEVAYAVLLAVGTFIPPVGIVHGVGVWFGAW